GRAMWSSPCTPGGGLSGNVVSVKRKNPSPRHMSVQRTSAHLAAAAAVTAGPSRELALAGLEGLERLLVHALDRLLLELEEAAAAGHPVRARAREVDGHQLLQRARARRHGGDGA